MKNQNKTFFYGIGHSMVDYFAENVLIYDELEKLKSPAHLEESDFDNVFSKIAPKMRKTGGTAVNILKTASKTGVECFFSGSTGMKEDKRDDDAIFFQREMAENKIECQLFSRENPTGRFLSISGKTEDGKEVQKVIVNVGAAKKIEVAQVNEVRFGHSNCFVMEGMQFMNQGVLEQIVDFSFRYNVPLAVDCGTIFGAEAVGKRLLDISNSLDIILFANEAEAAALKQYVEKPEDVCFLYVEKLGENGSKAFFDGKVIYQEAIKVPKKCEVACGDVFAGTLLAGIFKKTQNCFWDLKADDLPELLELASLEASKVLLNFGL